MKGLLLKEWYGVWNHCKITLFLAAACLIAFFTQENTEYFVFYPCLLVSMIPTTLCALDERSNWENYAISLPVSKKDLITAKYLLSAILNLATIIIVGGGYLIANINLPTFSWSGYAGLIAYVLGISFAGPAATLPFMFKYGVEKGRNISLFSMMIVYLPGLILLQDDIKPFISNQYLVFALIGFGAILLYIAAWKWSVKIYERKDF